MQQTYERDGKSGKILYIIDILNGRAVSALSYYSKEDGLGGIDRCIRRLDPNGPTVRKMLGTKQGK